MPRLYVEEMAEKNSGKRIGGSAELVSVSVNTKGYTVAYLRPRDAESVGIAVFVLPNKAKYVRSLPSGHRTKFVGTFVGLTMNTLVVKDGYVR
ncbi:MAG: hypothetical protein GF333_07810 [Candidatus Omnitrophica bacterium]|nr:hypothetical protein [Candidatus Omnitrophota bacterium]